MDNPTTPTRTWSNLLRSARQWIKPDHTRPTTRQRADAASSISATQPRAPVGFLINRADGLTGSQGTGYDYVWASNGLFVQSKGDLIIARIRINNQPTKGLLPTEEKIELVNGPIPHEILHEGLTWIEEEPGTERYFAIAWDGRRYLLRRPHQEGTPASVTYHTPDLPTVAEFHSHGPHAPFFSSTDDIDEQGFRIYGVTTYHPDTGHSSLLRLGIYGHHRNIMPSEVFTPQDTPPA